MISNQNYEIPISFIIYLLVKFLCILIGRRVSMHNTHPTLTSIPERNEFEDEAIKWVPKKKHEVLKAKYKCLKKLFQIYDASVIGILPETYTQDQLQQSQEESGRRKRSRRTKTDACAGTTESCGDVLDTEENAATAVIKDLNLDQIPSSQIDKSKTTVSKINDDKSTQDSKEDLSIDSDKECGVQSPHKVPYMLINEKRKLTRFQSFVQRILGIRREKNYTYVVTNDRGHTASDNNISNRHEKRRRRGLRLSRSRRAKKTHSEISLRDVKSPIILSYVQSIQRNCLMDTTSRQCPILGCKMLTHGIINYNDHLNLCHFNDRTYICLYCHEGFAKEYDKSVHENEHIGITKLNNMAVPPSTARFTAKIACNTQTEPEMSKMDVPEEKLKKIVAFFDKITDPGRIIAEMKRTIHSESNLHTIHNKTRIDTDSDVTKSLNSSEKSDTDKNTMSSMTLQNARSKAASAMDSEVTSTHTCVPPVRCQLCGENFDYRRQLCLHVDLVHRIHDKFSKYHSCAGIVNQSRTQDGIPKTRNATKTLAPASTDVSDISRRISDETLTYEPSTNIIYYTSTESINKKPTTGNTPVQKGRSSFCYKWEPGTKIIRV